MIGWDVSAIRKRILNGLTSGFVAPIAVLGVFSALIARAVYLLPGGYDGRGGLNATMGVLALVWAAAFAVRCLQPGSGLATAVEALCFFFLLSLFAALAAAASAVGAGNEVDRWLDLIDRTLFPAFDWKTAVTALPRFPRLYRTFNYIYGSLSWQPFLLIAVTLVVGRARDQIVFVSAWALGLLICILPFHWLPSASAYGFYGITRAQMPGSRFGLPWDLVPIVEGLRHGTIEAITAHCLGGLVTMPSFHACGATILGLAFWRYRLLRWPFAGLNTAMALVAVPIGGHYIIDIVAGSAAGVIAYRAACHLVKPGPRPHCGVNARASAIQVA